MPPAELIRSQLAAHDLSVAALAEATGIPRMTLTRRLADPGSFTLSELSRVAAVLDLPIVDLVAA